MKSPKVTSLVWGSTPVSGSGISQRQEFCSVDVSRGAPEGADVLPPGSSDLGGEANSH